MNKKNVYIVPSQNGFRYVAVNFFLFIISITYSNNLALLVTFFMVTYFIVQMFVTHKTIQDLELSDISIGNQYQGSANTILATFHSLGSKESFPYIILSVQDQFDNWSDAKFKSQESGKNLLFSMESKERKKVIMERIRFSTRGTNNLFYVWRYFKSSQTFYIYPKQLPASSSENFAKIEKATLLQEKEFEYHTRYVSGMPAKRIDWKKYASSNQLYSKSYSDNYGPISEINYSNLAGDKEEKLQKMSFLITKSLNQGSSYSLELPTKKLPVGGGSEQFLKSMELISEF